MKIISADERMAETQQRNTLAIFGIPGAGKTHLLNTLPPDTTFVLDLEAGLASAKSARFDSVTARSFLEFADIVVLLGGSNPALRPQDLFSEDHLQAAIKRHGPIDVGKYKTIFVDSVTEMSRLAQLYAKTLPGATAKNGTEDGFFIFRETANQALLALKQLQHAKGVNVIFVGVLQKRVDDFNRETWEPQLVGGQLGRELPGILDHVMTLAHFDLVEGVFTHAPGKGDHRAFVTRTPNPWSLPAKTRSSALDVVEQADLGKLLNKINGVV